MNILIKQITTKESLEQVYINNKISTIKDKIIFLKNEMDIKHINDKTDSKQELDFLENLILSYNKKIL